MASTIEIYNESDVEQKFIIQFLTSIQPLGLGYSLCDFRTKADLRQLVIGKGREEKLYYPDYVIILHGLPLLVIEAKRPDDNDIENALREARLYAAEINALFPTNLNPCQKIIATNSKRILCTAWDTNEVFIEITKEEIEASHPKLARLIEFAGKTTLSHFSDTVKKNIRGSTEFTRPTNLLGGPAVRQEELKLNSFGNTLALDYRHLFNPETIDERRKIVQNAYVTSSRRLRHVDPIDRIIRAAKPASVTDARQISSSEPNDLISTLGSKVKLQHQLLLLIGGVGSGKSTFVDYLKEIALPVEIKNSTLWVSLDMNLAPLSRDAIYPWIKNNVVKGINDLHSDIDVDSLEFLEKLFGIELRKIRKGPAAYFTPDSEKFKSILADELLRLQNDKDEILNAYIRFFCAEKEKLLIILLDNCDKRNLEDQLLMFDVAKWLQKTCRCLVFLPIRDTTYDHHRLEPPLDTVIKDLVFRIDAPLFMDVLYKRVKLALYEMKIEKDEYLSYDLPNGFRVEYPQSEQAYYLACIIKSLFQNDVLFRRIVSGIAGTDIRRGLEIFLDFCKSGHIQESEILKIRQAKGDYVLPKHIVTRVLFRGNRRYYHDANSAVKNLFASYPDDLQPDPYARIAILSWLKKNYRVKGSNGSLGYHKANNLIAELVTYGHDERRLTIEILSLIKSGCILSESQDLSQFRTGDLISISPSGHVHLELISNLDYLSSCSEVLNLTQFSHKNLTINSFQYQ
jgi:energy-coupling factor transporter ATP-binding protein EcfA2